MEPEAPSAQRLAYSTDLTDDQWQIVQECLPKAKGGRTGRKRKYPLREVVNGLFYLLRTGCPWRDLLRTGCPWRDLLRTGCPWRDLPHDLPPWGDVYDHFRRWRADGTIECLHDAPRDKARQQAGREVSPSAAALDSQSVKTGERGGRPVPSAMTRTRRSRAAGVT